MDRGTNHTPVLIISQIQTFPVRTMPANVIQHCESTCTIQKNKIVCCLTPIHQFFQQPNLWLCSLPFISLSVMGACPFSVWLQMSRRYSQPGLWTLPVVHQLGYFKHLVDRYSHSFNKPKKNLTYKACPYKIPSCLHCLCSTRDQINPIT